MTPRPADESDDTIDPRQVRKVSAWIKAQVPILTLIVASIAFIFGLGVNWRDTQENQAAVDALTQVVKTEYVRADVYKAEQARLSEAIDRLVRQLERMDAARRGAR